MRTRLRQQSDEKGAAVVEFALVLTLLLMLALGSFEYGMALRDWLSVSTATREGARVAASAANYNAADCVILEATAGALQSFRTGRIEYVFIYKSDAAGSFPANPWASSETNIYRPFTATPDVAIPECPFWTVENIGGAWGPANRVNPAPFGDPYWIGVRLQYEHDWYTNFLWFSGTATYSDASVFKVEPRPPN